MSQTDVLIVDVFLCLPTFQLLCLLILPNYKTQRFPRGAEQSSEYFLLSSSHSIHPITHMLCVCVCFCVRVIYASHSILIAIYENNAFDLTATLNKPLFKQNNLPLFDLDDNCILSWAT